MSTETTTKSVRTQILETLEAMRHHSPPDDKVPEFNGVEVELADLVIRCMDYCEAKGLRLAEAIVAKAEFNKTRSHMHGGKAF